MTKRLCMSPVLLLALATAAGAGCLAFNESCPVKTPEIWGQLNVQLDIRREVVRRCETPVGNLITDALLNYDYGLRTPGNEPIRPLLALLNSGAIRDEIICEGAGEKREYIGAGPVTDLDIHQLLPFNNTIVVVELTGRRLKNVLEWGVSALGMEGKAGEKGFFLQVAAENGIRIDVDCSRQPQTLNSERTQIISYGSRITAVTIANTPLADDGVYRLATLDYLLGKDNRGVPNDGFVAFHDLSLTPEVKVYPTHLPLTDVVRIRLGSSFPADYPKVESRIEPQGCNYQCPR